MAERFLIFGHRGSPNQQPENTLASFEAALRGGADGFETDLRLLSDGVAVLYHEDEVGERPIEALSWSEVEGGGLGIEQLRELTRFAGRTSMVLEVKRGGWEKQLIAEVGSWPNVVVASFDHEAIAELARHEPPFALGLTISGTIVDLAAYARRLSATWCYPNYRFVDQRVVSSLHAAAIRVVPWTPDRPQEWERLRSIGCDGLITNLPAEAVQWRRAGR
jgi:glycerophosphoryl diester phosphodiesterase